MTLRTQPIFYFGIEVTNDCNWVDLREDGATSDISFQVPNGNYTLEELRAVLENSLNQNGAYDCYKVQIDRFTRKMTISAEGFFEFLLASGANANNSLLRCLGFDTRSSYGESSPAAASSLSQYGDSHLLYGYQDTGLFGVHRGTECIGCEYCPQFCIQDYMDAENNCALRKPSINESVNGDCVEVISFGEDRFYEMNFKYITDRETSCDAPIKNNPNAVEQINKFLKWAIKLKVIEYMPDKDNRSEFYKVRLVKARGNSKGTGYRLKELVGQGLPEFYETGKLTFRRISK